MGSTEVWNVGQNSKQCIKPVQNLYRPALFEGPYNSIFTGPP